MIQSVSRLRSAKRRYLRSLSFELEQAVLEDWFTVGSLGGRILDCGGGASPYAGLLGASARVINIDMALKADTHVVADGHDLPFPGGSIDAVILTNVLEHVREPQRLLAELARVLVDGGQLILVVPFLFKIHPDPEDHWRFTAQALRRMLEPAFEIAELRSLGGRFAVIWEVLLQMRGWEVLRLFNPVIARVSSPHPDYPLAYCVRAVRRT